jgi:hydroxymethylglutaryl-CoA lyase
MNFNSLQGIVVLVSEVSLRDGLQRIKRKVPSEVKLDWIKALTLSVFREIEVASFVSPRLLPQIVICAML